VLADKQGRDGAEHPNHFTVNRLEITLIGEILRFAWVVGCQESLRLENLKKHVIKLVFYQSLGIGI